MSPEPRLIIFSAGLSRDEALDRFVAHCGTGPEVLFLTDSWFSPRREELTALLPATLTADQANAFDDVLHKRVHLDTMLMWLRHEPTPWAHIEGLRRSIGEAAVRTRREEGFFPWDDVDACRGASPVPSWSGEQHPPETEDLDGCHGCGRSAGELEWLYFRSPEWTWTRMCGRAGWMGICPQCRFQIHFFLDTLN